MAEALAVSPQTSISALLRQAGVLIALAAAVALGLYVALWSRTPEYSVLYTDLSERDLSQVVDALDANNTPYRIDHRSGVVLVAADKVHEVRLRLAASGLPKSAGMGFEMLDEEQGFGTSQFREQARYQRAIEGELSRSIARIDTVQSARVHLALPKQSAFSRTRREPTASVIVDLYNGHRLEPHQVGAIVHMVSASVASMAPDHVTVIDQQGNLLSDGHGGGDEFAVTAKRFEYTRRLEQSYIERVEAILIPMVGPDGVRAQVTADIDFTTTEQTRESFNPDLPSIRSESLVEEERHGVQNGGVPGALSNEPPAGAVAPELSASDSATTELASAAAPRNRRSQTTRNYELDRTIAHTKPAVGRIRRLSVAVVLRNPRVEATAGNESSNEETSEDGNGFEAAELEQMENLVKQAIGFDATRGDSVNMTNVDFLEPPIAAPLPKPALWEQPWVWSVGKQVVGGVVVLFILFGVIRPAAKSLVKRPLEMTAGGDPQVLLANGGVAGGAAGQPGGVTALPNGLSQSQSLMVSSDVDPNIDSVKQFVNQDPKIAAQVIKGWVGE